MAEKEHLFDKVRRSLSLRRSRRRSSTKTESVDDDDAFEQVNDFILELGYWDIQGAAQSIRYLLHFQNDVQFMIKNYKWSSHKNDWLMGDKARVTQLTDFPNLPYLVTKECGVVTGSTAIMRYLGQRCGLAGTTSQENTMIDIIDGVMSDARQRWEKAMDETYNRKKLSLHLPFDDKPCKTKIYAHEDFKEGIWARLEKHLSKNKFAAGERITWVDFRLLYYFNIWIRWSRYFSVLPNIRRYMSDLLDEASPRFMEFFKTTNEKMPVAANVQKSWQNKPPNKLRMEFASGDTREYASVLSERIERRKVSKASFFSAMCN